MSSHSFPPIGGWGNPAWPWTPNDGFRSIELQGHLGQSLLMSANVTYSITSTEFTAQAPVGTFERPSWLVSIPRFDVYPAATVARSSAGDDIPSNKWVPDVLQQTLNYGRGTFNGADPRSQSNPSSGVIELDDPQGDLEYLFRYAWDGASITMYRGREQDPFKTWAVVGKFNSAAIIGDMNKKQIKLRDIGWKLAVPLHGEYYLGTGGLEGDESLEGKWKPYCVGYCFNVEPVLINAEHQVYQFNFCGAAAIMALRHGGVAITFHADYATYELLIAAIVPPGTYATCKAKSLVLPSLDIEKSIRVDVQGDSANINAHGIPTTRAAIVRRIATAYGDSYLDDFENIDSESFTKLENDHSAIVGFFWDSEINKDRAMYEVMSGILGWWDVKPNGLLTVGYAQEPRITDSVARIAFQEYNMSLITMTDFATPRHATHIGWKRNYAPEARSQLAGSVTEDFAHILSEETLYAVDHKPEILALYPTSETVKILGNYWTESDALEEATRQQILMGKERRRYRVTLEIDVFADILGQTITLTDVNKLMLGPSKTLMCVNIDSVGFGPATIDLWG